MQLKDEYESKYQSQKSEDDADANEQYSSRLCVRIYGISPAVNEIANVLNKAQNKWSNSGLDNPDNVIDTAH